MHDVCTISIGEKREKRGRKGSKDGVSTLNKHHNDISHSSLLVAN